MTTFTGTQSDFTSALKDLIALEYDALSAYETAILKLESEKYKAQFIAFKADHQRHIQELSDFLRHRGEDFPQEGDYKEWLTKGKIFLANLIGDKAILSAMRSNEFDTNTAYERITSREDQLLGIENIIERGLEDEKRHKSWIEEELERA